ncbi:unnamed protein product [Effrenium voratum]|nr:unnamed protein product [Effrenium voratum]
MRPEGIDETSGIEGRVQELPMTACVQSVKPQEQAFLAVSLEDLALQTFCACSSSLAFGVLAHSGGFTSAQLRGATACTEQLCRPQRMRLSQLLTAAEADGVSNRLNPHALGLQILPLTCWWAFRTCRFGGDLGLVRS